MLALYLVLKDDGDDGQAVPPSCYTLVHGAPRAIRTTVISWSTQM